jgi:hypothetical protein
METDQQDILTSITDFLSGNNIPYMVTGAWSVIYYGRPRASHDIDFVVEIEPHQTEKILTILKTLPHDFQFQEDAIREAIKNKGLFNIIHVPTYLKLDFWLLTADEFDKNCFQRRQEVEALGQKMMLATAEDTILQKLRWYKISPIEKSLIDAAFVYQIQKNNLNIPYLTRWAKFLHVTKQLKKLGTIDLEPYI